MKETKTGKTKLVVTMEARDYGDTRPLYERMNNISYWLRDTADWLTFNKLRMVDRNAFWPDWSIP